METCCTCATELSSAPPYAPEKGIPEDRRVQCCSRVICGPCIDKNSRFGEYCPFCQVSSVPSSLPQRLREPPVYASSSSRSSQSVDLPPPYVPSPSGGPPLDDEKAALANAEKPADDTLHFLNHEHDNIASLSLRYGVPASALRRANNITSDHLLLGRKTVIIPGEYYKGGISLSPQPIDGEEEELRKAKIRRLMTSCKIFDYDVAVLYLEQSGYDIDAATEAYISDEEWAKLHPAKGKTKSGRGSEQVRKSRGLFG